MKGEISMKRVTIGGKEYTFKYSVDASLYNECTESTMELLLNFGEAQGAAQAENVDYMTAARKVIGSITNIPQTALTLFYAGLLEYHGIEGDKSVRSLDDAKKLLKTYLAENEGLSFYDVLTSLMETMGDDNFFALTGMDDMLSGGKKKGKKSPDDGKK